jgi:hypothetical protein
VAHLRATGRLALDPPRLDQQPDLFQEFQGGSNGS